MCAPLGGPQGSLSCLGRWATSALSPVPVGEESPLPRATLLLRGSHVRRLTEGTASSLRPCPRRTTLKRVPAPERLWCSHVPVQGPHPSFPTPRLPRELPACSTQHLRACFPGKSWDQGWSREDLHSPPAGWPEAFTGGGTLPALVSCGPDAVKACGW